MVSAQNKRKGESIVLTVSLSSYLCTVLGTILVVDEADKAPTYVTAVLKSLVEDGQMVLGDGRRIISKESDIQDNDRYILVHPNFRMLVLANRPGIYIGGKNAYS